MATAHIGKHAARASVGTVVEQKFAVELVGQILQLTADTVTA